MADDIHLTEEEQVERIKQWWKQNGLSIVIGVAGGLALVFAYQYWQDKKVATTEKASALYEEIAADTQPVISELSTKSAQFKSDYASTPYAEKVALLTAKHAAEKGDLATANTELSWVVNNSKDTFNQHLARTRLASVLIEQQQLDDAKKLIKVADKGSFESNYLEAEADIARLQNDFVNAKSLYEQALEKANNDPYAAILQLRINQVSSAITQAANSGENVSSQVGSSQDSSD